MASDPVITARGSGFSVRSGLSAIAVLCGGALTTVVSLLVMTWLNNRSDANIMGWYAS